MFQTYLIIGGSQEKRRDEAMKICGSRGGKKVDTFLVPKDEETSIKIEHVREIQQTIMLPPLLGKVKTVVFLEMERASTETQHALLKLLEEPPTYALIILTAAKKESLLPTILSRASIKKLLNAAGNTNWEDQYNKLVTTLRNRSTKFSEGSSLDTKEAAVVWLQNTLESARHVLLSEHSKHKHVSQSFIQLIRKTNRALNTLQTTNTNPRLLMENLLLDLSASPIT